MSHVGLVVVKSILLMKLEPVASVGMEASSFISTSPRRSVWPGFKTPSMIFLSSTKVPLEDSRSRTTSSSPRSRTSQCRPETDASTIWNVLPSCRPIVIHLSPSSWAMTVSVLLVTTSLCMSLIKQSASAVVNCGAGEPAGDGANCPCFGRFQHLTCLNFCNSSNHDGQMA